MRLALSSKPVSESFAGMRLAHLRIPASPQAPSSVPALLSPFADADAVASRTELSISHLEPGGLASEGHLHPLASCTLCLFP